MAGFLSILASKRIWTFVVLPNVGFIIVAALTQSKPLIGVLSLVLIALAVAVCVAFAPNVLKVLTQREPARDSQIIAVGIFLAWFSIVLGAALSLTWRYIVPWQWLIDSDANSYRLFQAICAAIFHLAAPASVDGNIPPRRWVKIGMIAAVGVFVGLLLLYMSDIKHEADRILRRTSAPIEDARPL